MLHTIVNNVSYNLGNIKFKIIFFVNLDVLVNKVVCFR